MPNFSYSYQGQTKNAFAEHFLDSGYHRYLITLDDGSRLTIAPLGIPGKNGIIWEKANKPGDTLIHDHELVQALGEGVESSKLFLHFKNPGEY